MSHEVHNAELVQAVEPELPPWREYVAIGTCVTHDMTEYWLAADPQATPQDAAKEFRGLVRSSPAFVFRLPDPRKPQPAPRVVIEWRDVEYDLGKKHGIVRLFLDDSFRKLIEAHARIEVTHE